MYRIKNLAAYALVALGAVLLFLGAREFLDSRVGQSEVSEQFEDTTPVQPAPVPAPGQAPQPAPPPRRIAIGDAIGKLVIPRLGTELFVIEGDGASELRRAPGHLPGTVMPGAKGNCVIAGHRDTHFRVLKDIRKGDDIVLETRSGEYLYRVEEMKVISPRNVAPLLPTADSQLNLITCYPFYYIGSAPRRFVVQARLAGLLSATPES
jgi:sortase A